MQQRSVFDVAEDVMRMLGQDSISRVKIQKMVYYTFGWYGAVTGRPLFDQNFLAMEYGPVVSELLTLNSGQWTVTRDLISDARSDYGDVDQPPDELYYQVLRAVIDRYGDEGQWHLSDRTHEEPPWSDAWRRRPVGAKRADIDQADIIEYFNRRPDRPALLPESQVTFLSDDEYARLEALLA